MPPERFADQAAGLRRLRLRATAQVITVVAARAGMGTSSIVVNLSAALADSGLNVLVLDENLSHDNVSNMLALKPRFDLLHAVRRDKLLHEVLLHRTENVRVLPAARAIQALPSLTAPEHGYLLECLAQASRGIDIVLVDAAADQERCISSGMTASQPMMLVLNPSASAITESYAMLKRMSLQDGRLCVGVVVNKVRDEQEARTIFSNMAQVASQYLQVSVKYLGHIPLDEKLKRATQLCCPVAEAFAEASSVRAFDQLGRNLMLLPAASSGEAGGLPEVVRGLMRQARLPRAAYAS